MREHFLDRIYGEYQAYRASVLGGTNAEIFARSYEIDAVVNFYEILVEKAELLSDQILVELLQQRNILMGCYHRWLKKEDSHYNEMKAHVEDEIESLIAENAKTRKLPSEKQDGRFSAGEGEISVWQKKRYVCSAQTRSSAG